MKIDIEELEKAISEVLGGKFEITEYYTAHSTGKGLEDGKHQNEFGIVDEPYTKIGLSGFVK